MIYLIFFTKNPNLKNEKKNLFGGGEAGARVSDIFCS